MTWAIWPFRQLVARARTNSQLLLPHRSWLVYSLSKPHHFWYVNALISLIRTDKRPSLRFSQAMRVNASPSMMRWLSNDTRVKIQNAVKEDPLVVFMKGSPSMPQCGFSRAVLQILQVQGVNTDKVATYNCLEDQELRDGIKEFSDWPTIPQVYINGEFVGGCDILLNLHQTGELETMLREAGLLLEATENQQ